MNQVRKADPNNKTVAENRKARFSYEVLDTVEAGLVLTGTEVKSLRQGQANIQEAYASLEGGEIWLINSYLPEYLQANRFNHEPRRRRKLLLNKREMAKLGQSVDREGMTHGAAEDLLQRPGPRQAAARRRARQEAARQARDRKAARLGAREGPAAEGPRVGFVAIRLKIRHDPSQTREAVTASDTALAAFCRSLLVLRAWPRLAIFYFMGFSPDRDVYPRARHRRLPSSGRRSTGRALPTDDVAFAIIKATEGGDHRRRMPSPGTSRRRARPALRSAPIISSPSADRAPIRR